MMTPNNTICVSCQVAEVFFNQRCRECLQTFIDIHEKKYHILESIEKLREVEHEVDDSSDSSSSSPTEKKDVNN
jgi:hypothetical protein